ncbi:MAG: ribose-5-phosphate isomerase [Armatimonadetes bacterium]|nr:ribose-5-phosphate isomerase [Armatimonadota bacterium]
MKIAIAADHAGYELKERLKSYLTHEGHNVVDLGPESYEPTDDYPDYAIPAAEMVARGEADRGILVCDSGIGVDIAANKIPGVRSALVHDEELAKLTRQHNDTNVLSLGSMFVDETKARKIVKNWLDTPFSRAERHERRIRKIEKLEQREVTNGATDR